MNLKRATAIGLTALTVLGGAVVSSSSAEARPFGGGWGHHYGGYYGHHGWRGGGWIGPAVVGGLALGALAAAPYYAYGPECVLERRVRPTPYGPVVRHVRVCY